MLSGTRARLMAVAGVCCTLATVLSACQNSSTPVGPDDGPGAVSELVGNVVIDGSSTVYPIAEAISAAFLEGFPDVKVTVAVSGTGGGFKRFSRGETDISDASRPIKAAEFQQCVENKVTFLELPVAYDGLTVVVNPANDWVKEMTVEDLQKIFLEEHAAKSWKDVRPDWPDKPIKIYAPGTDSGTFDYFHEVMGGPMRKDMSTNEDDNVLVTGVAGEKGAIGFFGVAYFSENQEKLRAVPIVNPKSGQAVMPTAKTIESGEYFPLSRPLFIYVREASLKRPECRKFVEFFLDRAKSVAPMVGYVGLTDEIYGRVRECLKSRRTGTYFLTESGEPREGSLSDIYTEENLRPVETN